MAVDTSIYQNLLRPPKSVLEYGAEMDQAEASQLGLASARAASQQAQQAQRDDQALRALYAKPGFDPLADSSLADIMRISPKAGMTAQKSMLDAQKTKAEIGETQAKTTKQGADAEKVQLETAIAKQAQIAQAAGAAVDQASWDRGLQIAQSLGIDVSQVPKQFNPQTAAQVRQQAMTGAQQLEQVWKQKGYDLDVRKQGEVERNNRTQNSISQGNLAVSRERLNFDQQQPKGVYDAERGVLVDPRTGQAQPVTMGGAPIAAKKPSEQTQKITDAKDALALLDQAEPLLNAATGSYIGEGMDQGARAFGMSTSGAQAAAQLKALEGALISKMPKMSGPQSDKDVLLYKQMAGQIGDSTLPAATKRAAIQTIREINERHSGVTPKSTGGATGGWDVKRVP